MEVQETAEKTLRVGVVGLGMGRHHVRAFQAHPNAEVIAVADSSPQRLEEIGNEYRVAGRYTDLSQMLAREKLDIVSLALPNRLHKPMTIEALRAGCHVLCEKPPAMSTTEAIEMRDVAKEAGLRIAYNFSFRYKEENRAMKRLVEDGAIGRVYYASTGWLRRSGIPGLGGWFTDREQSGGGPLIDLGVHRLDLALWLMGHPQATWVMAGTSDELGHRHAEARGKSFNVEDFASAMVRFADGTTLHLHASWAGHIEERELMHTRLMGEEGGCMLANTAGGYGQTAKLYADRAGVPVNIEVAGPPDGPQSVMAELVDSILENRPNAAGPEEGIAVMRILDGIYESARTGEPVRIGH